MQYRFVIYYYANSFSQDHKWYLQQTSNYIVLILFVQMQLWCHWKDSVPCAVERTIWNSVKFSI